MPRWTRRAKKDLRALASIARDKAPATWEMAIKIKVSCAGLGQFPKAERLGAGKGHARAGHSEYALRLRLPRCRLSRRSVARAAYTNAVAGIRKHDTCIVIALYAPGFAGGSWLNIK